MSRFTAALLMSLAGAAAWVVPARAFDFNGEKAIVAVTKDGTRTRIGSVRFSPAAGGASAFAVRMDHAVMRDHFLSMREFKCLGAEQEVTCFVPYPYQSPAVVGPDHLAWLEHHLLFFYKQPRDYGAKLWNGIAFRFTRTPTALVGRPQAVDLNRIGVPPDDLTVPPYGAFDRDDFSPGVRWVQELRIE